MFLSLATAAACNFSSSVPAAPAGFPDVVSLVERVAPSVVTVITTSERTDHLGRSRQGTSNGSGVLFDGKGYILTNNHVIEGGTLVEVVLSEDPFRRWAVEVLGTDPITDLAVLKLELDGFPYDLVPVPLGDADKLRVGEWVVAIGSPLGEGFAGTVTVGIVSGKDRSLRLANGWLHNLIQTDAVINPGNSGGPLFNLNGEIVGINTAIIRGQLASGQEAEGIGFAVSASTAMPVAAQLIENGEVIWPWLGVAVRNLTPAIAIEEELSVEQGIVILATVPGGPADKAGIEALDVIVAMDGVDVESVTALQRTLRSGYQIGDEVDVAVVRGDETRVFSIDLERQPR